MPVDLRPVEYSASCFRKVAAAVVSALTLARRRAGRHRAVARLNMKEVAVAHPVIVS
jgi:hypothetical protein